jgi:lysophospholipase L1-like esterase
MASKACVILRRFAKRSLEGRKTALPLLFIAGFYMCIPGGEAPRAESVLPCGHFTQAKIADPAPRENDRPKRRLAQINAEIKVAQYRIVYFGDSITQGWDKALWEQNLAPRHVFNAGVDGDRTEHLRWRLDHGNLAGKPPQAAIVLIGTNDLGHGRPPEIAAEGIRAVIAQLRERLPEARILLLGLWPREAAPDAPLRRAVEEVNRRIKTCGNGSSIIYADIGGALLEPGGSLSPAVSPDRLHFSAAGYARIVPQLLPLIDRLLAAR